jgi:hypothetical protein
MTTWTTIESLVQANVPVVLWGPPGTGKTARVHQMAERLGLTVETVILSQREPADVAGMPLPPAPGERGIRWEPPGWAVRLAAAGRGILFFDELSCAAPAVQAAALRIIQERCVGELSLPAEVRVVAAANPPDQAAGGWDLEAPTANRLAHVEVSADLTEWGEWALAAHAGDRPGEVETRALVLAFLRARPGLLLAVPQDTAQRGRAWPSPRTWAAVARATAGLGTGEASVRIAQALVGDGPALEWCEWVRRQDLPDPEWVLAHPASWTPSERGDATYAVAASVVAAVAGKVTKERWGAAWAVLARVCDSGQPDLAAVAGRALARLGDRKWSPPACVASLVPVLRGAGLLGGVS